MPDPDKTMKKWKIFKDHFPMVNFAPFDKKSPDNLQLKEIPPEIYDMLLRDCMAGNDSLDIPKMAKKSIFRPLFPEPELVKANEAVLNKMKESGERPNVVVYFVSEYEERFASGLNAHLEKKDRIDLAGKFLADKFDREVLRNSCCQYSLTTRDDGESEEKFEWYFSGHAFSHELSNSVYKAFRYYAKKNCTLYLLGAEFINFRDRPGNWPIVPVSGQPLPAYFSGSDDISKGLNKDFNEIHAGDFVWKQGSGWGEDGNKRHLLKSFKLDVDLNVGLKDIWYSFCVPVLNKKGGSGKINEDYIIEYGGRVIDNTLKRNIALATGQISRYPIAWLEIINETLESTPRGADKFCPTKLETFIAQIAGQSHYIKEKSIKLEAKEDGTLNQNDHQNIRNYFLEKDMIRGLLPPEELESFDRVCEDGNAYEKIEKLYKLMSFVEIKAVFQTRYPMIEALYWKAFTVSIEKHRKDNDGKSLPDGIIEDTKQLSFENMLITKNLKGLVLENFEDEFMEKEWIQFIRKENDNILFADLGAYRPRSQGRLENAINSNLFKKYCEVLHITIKDAHMRTTLHTGFATKMRNITDNLETKLQELGYWRT